MLYDGKRSETTKYRTGRTKQRKDAAYERKIDDTAPDQILWGAHRSGRPQLSVRDGEFLSILGPSGCGKTTLLRILIGIESADGGDILKDGVSIRTAPPPPPGHGNRVPELRALPQYDGFAERNLRPPLSAGTKGEGKGHCSGYFGKGRPDRVSEQKARAAVGRPAAAGSHCPHSGAQPGYRAVRRADVGAGRGQPRRPCGGKSKTSRKNSASP